MAINTWVKTDADTASCILPAGHGYTNATFDVYSATGAIYRYGVTGTVSGNNLTLDGGSVPTGGAGFPATETGGVIVCKQQRVNVSIDGDIAVLVGILVTCPAHLNFQDVSNNTIRRVTLATGEPDLWDSGQNVNPYTGEPITKIRLSNGSATAGAFQILISQAGEVALSPSTSPSASVSASRSSSPSASVSSSPSASTSASPSSSPSASVSSTPSASVSATPSSSPSASVSNTPSASVSATPSSSPSASVSASPSSSPSAT
jgi:hypothetical protein